MWAWNRMAISSSMTNDIHMKNHPVTSHLFWSSLSLSLTLYYICSQWFRHLNNSNICVGPWCSTILQSNYSLANVCAGSSLQCLSAFCTIHKSFKPWNNIDVSNDWMVWLLDEYYAHALFDCGNWCCWFFSFATMPALTSIYAQCCVTFKIAHKIGSLARHNKQLHNVLLILSFLHYILIVHVNIICANLCIALYKCVVVSYFNSGINDQFCAPSLVCLIKQQIHAHELSY